MSSSLKYIQNMSSRVSTGLAWLPVSQTESSTADHGTMVTKNVRMSRRTSYAPLFVTYAKALEDASVTPYHSMESRSEYPGLNIDYTK